MKTRNYLLRFLILFGNLHVIKCSSKQTSTTSYSSLECSKNASEKSSMHWCEPDVVNTLPSSNILAILGPHPDGVCTTPTTFPATPEKVPIPGEVPAPLVLSREFSRGTMAQIQNGKVFRFVGQTSSSPMEELSLQNLLTKIISEDLTGCDLIILIDRSFKESLVLQTLVQQPNFKQVMMLDDLPGEFGDRVSWRSSRCQGILVLISEPRPFIEFGKDWPNAWDYRARTVIVGLNKVMLETFIETRKARKIENIVGIVKSNEIGSFRIFMNQLFWGTRGLTQVSTWRMNSFTLDANLFPDKVTNLEGASLILVSFELEPFIINHRDSDGQLLYRYGRDVKVYKALQDFFNFTIVHLAPDPRELFGVPLPNGSFNGITGMLDKGEGDLAIDDIWLIIDRTPFLDYSAPYSVDQGCFMAPAAPPLALWESPVLPYQMITWIVIFAGMVFAGPLLYLLVKGSHKRDSEAKCLRSLTTSTLYATGVHFSHPMAALPKSSGTQVFVAFLWLYSVILTTGYKSNLTAFLTITSEPKSIETILELYKSGLRVKGYNFFVDQFERSKIDYVRKLVNRYDTYLCFDEVKDDVLFGKAVLINSVKYLEFHIGQLLSSAGTPIFRIMKECMPQYSVVMAYQKHSPLKPKFDPIITRLFESGLPKKWFLETISTYRMLHKQDAEASQTTEDRSQDGVTALGLDHLQGVFIVWAFGSICSTMTFGAEVLLA